MHFANVFRRKKSRFAKIDSIGISDPLDCEKSLCNLLMFFRGKNLDSAQNGQIRQYRDLRPFGLRKIPMHFPNVFWRKKSRKKFFFLRLPRNLYQRVGFVKVAWSCEFPGKFAPFCSPRLRLAGNAR